MSLPTASVVVAARDARATIVACIGSLLALDYPSELLEVLVVDNGSRDGTRDVLAAHVGEITVVSEPRRGRAIARNAGIRAARGEVIAFTDADCTVDPGWLKALVEMLADPSVGVVGGPILPEASTTRARHVAELTHDHEQAILGWKPGYVVTASWASRKAVLEEAGLFDESLARCSDVDLSWRISQAGYSLAYCPAAVVRHRLGGSALELFTLGFGHGFHAVEVRRKHAAFIAAAAASEPERDRTRARTGAAVAFRSGKRLGNAVGRLRR